MEHSERYACEQLLAMADIFEAKAIEARGMVDRDNPLTITNVVYLAIVDTWYKAAAMLRQVVAGEK